MTGGFLLAEPLAAAILAEGAADPSVFPIQHLDFRPEEAQLIATLAEHMSSW